MSAFPGDVGGAAANVNRWRGQIGLNPVSETEALSLLNKINTADGEAQWVELTGADGEEAVRMLGAIVPRGGQTWFYKIMGSESLVAQEKDALLKFVRSAKY